MSNQFLLFSIASIGLLGVAMSLHLVLHKRNSIPAKILGCYTFLLTLSSIEPLKEYLSTASFFVEIIVAIGSFMIGPMLFLYCKYRLKDTVQWNKADIFHFVPACLLLILVLAGSGSVEEDTTADIIFYLLFVCQIFAYSITSFSIVWKKKMRDASGTSLRQFHLNFVFGLVISSVILFAYSFGSTLVGFNNSLNFKFFIQAFLSLVIIVIVFLNAEALEDHELSDTHKKRTVRK